MNASQTATSGLLHPIVQCSCGSRTFERLTPVHGIWREYVVFNEDGSEDFENSESTTDDLRHGKAPKTMKCANCGKRHRNPDTLNKLQPFLTEPKQHEQTKHRH